MIPIPHTLIAPKRETLFIANGETVTLEQGVVHKYNYVQIDVGGTLTFEPSYEVLVTGLWCGKLVLNGTIDGSALAYHAGQSTGDSPSTHPDGTTGISNATANTLVVNQTEFTIDYTATSFQSEGREARSAHSDGTPATSHNVEWGNSWHGLDSTYQPTNDAPSYFYGSAGGYFTTQDVGGIVNYRVASNGGDDNAIPGIDCETSCPGGGARAGHGLNLVVYANQLIGNGHINLNGGQGGTGATAGLGWGCCSTGGSQHTRWQMAGGSGGSGASGGKLWVRSNNVPSITYSIAYGNGGSAGQGAVICSGGREVSGFVGYNGIVGDVDVALI